MTENRNMTDRELTDRELTIEDVEVVEFLEKFLGEHYENIIELEYDMSIERFIEFFIEWDMEENNGCGGVVCNI